MDSDHADDAEEQAQAMGDNQENGGPAAVKTVSQAAIENRPDVLKRLVEEGKPFQDKDGLWWTAMHHAAFLGHTECMRILLSNECGIDDKAMDGSTPLMAACANLPRSKECVRVLCEYKADARILKNCPWPRSSALDIAILRKPDPEVVELLVSSGADVGSDQMKSLFWWQHSKNCGVQQARVMNLPGEAGHEHLEADETEVAEVAMYLARQGCVKNALTLSQKLISKIGIQSPQLLDKVVECFLEEGAVFDINEANWKSMTMSIFAKKSIIYLEGIPTSSIDNHDVAMKVLLFQGMAAGTLPLTTVKDMQDRLLTRTRNLPDEFLPLKTLFWMTRSVPTLSQLARSEIRRKMAECGKFSRENLKTLELPVAMIDFMQLKDLGDGKEVDSIMENFSSLLIALM